MAWGGRPPDVAATIPPIRNTIPMISTGMNTSVRIRNTSVRTAEVARMAPSKVMNHTATNSAPRRISTSGMGFWGFWGRNFCTHFGWDWRSGEGVGEDWRRLEWASAVGSIVFDVIGRLSVSIRPPRASIRLPSICPLSAVTEDCASCPRSLRTCPNTGLEQHRPSITSKKVIPTGKHLILFMQNPIIYFIVNVLNPTPLFTFHFSLFTLQSKSAYSRYFFRFTWNCPNASCHVA
jgi:hypothetical protein